MFEDWGPPWAQPGWHRREPTRPGAPVAIVSVLFPPYLISVAFEYDSARSAANKAKHGIDFEEAQALWDDPWLLQTQVRTEDEPRFLAVGLIGRRHWTAVDVPRKEAAHHLGAPCPQGGDDAVGRRLSSKRRSTPVGT